MDKYITLEWPYENVHLKLSDRPRVILDQDQWDALEKAERALFSGQGPAVMGVSDVNGREDVPWLKQLWDYIESGLEYATGDPDDWDKLTRVVKNQRIAARMARVLAMAFFGPEWLLR